MKKFKNGFLALALIAGVSFAVVAKVQAMPKQDDPTYDWNGSGPGFSGELDNVTVAVAQSTYDCSGTNAVCATGTIDQGSGPEMVTIRKN